MKESMEQPKRRMPAIILLESKAVSYALVLARNPHGEHFTAIFRTVDFPILTMEIRAKDKLHASFFARIKNFIHVHKGLSSWQATSEPVAELQQKNPKCRTSGKSFGIDRGILVLQQETLPYMLWTFLIRSANITKIQLHRLKS